MWTWEILVLIIIAIIFYKFYTRRKLKLPPGPPRLPLIGSLLHFIWAGGNKPAFACHKLSKKYGPVFSLQTGFVNMVVLNSYDTLVEIASKDGCLNRIDEADKWMLAKANGLPVGLIFGRDNLWAETRAFCHTLLRKYGFNTKSVTESLLLAQIKDFCENLKSDINKEGPTVKIENQFTVVFFNVIWMLLTGKEYPRDDSFLKKLSTATAGYLKSGKLGGGIAGLYPELIEYFPALTGYKELMQKSQEWVATLQGLLEEYRRDGTYKSSPQNFIEDYLIKIDEANENGQANPLGTIFTDASLVAVLQDFLIGGTDSQSHLMKFLIRQLLVHPEIQSKLHEEVDHVVGKNRLPSVTDIPNLVYTQATLLELYRVEVPAAMTVRRIDKDCKIGQFDIPKGTQILWNLYGANHEEATWENPTAFQPERFLSPTGRIFNTEKIMSFGFGRRRCIGESLAKVNMVLAVAAIVQEFVFDVHPHFGIPPADSDIHGFTRDIRPFNVSVKIRRDQ